jgi:hypothetical protein
MTAGTSRSAPTTITDIYPSGAGYDRMTGTIGGTNYTTAQIDRVRLMPAAVALPVDQQFTYYYTPVPEPSDYAALAGVAALAVGYWRRRRVG